MYFAGQVAYILLFVVLLNILLDQLIEADLICHVGGLLSGTLSPDNPLQTTGIIGLVMAAGSRVDILLILTRLGNPVPLSIRFYIFFIWRLHGATQALDS